MARWESVLAAHQLVTKSPLPPSTSAAGPCSAWDKPTATLTITTTRAAAVAITVSAPTLPPERVLMEEWLAGGSDMRGLKAWPHRREAQLIWAGESCKATLTTLDTDTRHPLDLSRNGGNPKLNGSRIICLEPYRA